MRQQLRGVAGAGQGFYRLLSVVICRHIVLVRPALVGQNGRRGFHDASGSNVYYP
jgi:hypothetical protein